MVTAATSFGRNGVSDFLIQRFSAIVLAVYTIFIVAYLAANPGLTYEQWLGLHSQMWMKIFSLTALLSMAAHGWIGLWGILTDYVTERMMGGKALLLRMLILSVFAVVTFAYVVWCIDIVWGA